MRCNFQFPFFQMSYRERSLKKLFLSFFFKTFSVFFLFIISVTHSLQDEVLLSLHPFFQSCLFITFFPFFTALTSVLLRSKSSLQDIKDSIWQGLDTISDNIFIVLLSLTVASSSFLGIPCCLAFHLSQGAAAKQRNIRTCQMQKNPHKFLVPLW